MFDTDVFILGGGPAGLAAAIAARRRGLRVVLADAEHPPIDKACGEGLMPDSLAAAAALGIEIPDHAGHAFRGIRFCGPHQMADADFPEGYGRGIRRTVLHPLLVEAAKNAGVELRWNTTVTGLDGTTVQMGRSTLRAGWIVGADGSQSRVRRWAGLEQFARFSRRYGFRQHFRVAPWSEYVEIHWGEGCQFYVTPIADDEICVVLMSRDSHLRLADALPRFPALQSRLGAAAASTTERGSPAATRRLERVHRGRVALIGDASGTVDPITGAGLCQAFHQAVALADAIARDDLTAYGEAHRRQGRRPVFMGDFMLLLDRFPWLRGRTLSALAARPQLFANLLAMHVGRLSVPQFAATAASLGWRIAIS